MSDEYDDYDDEPEFNVHNPKPREDGIKQRIYDKKISLYKALVIELERAKGEKSDQQILFLKSHIALLDGLL
jgi:hypothetical protein